MNEEVTRNNQDPSDAEPTQSLTWGRDADAGPGVDGGQPTEQAVPSAAEPTAVLPSAEPTAVLPSAEPTAVVPSAEPTAVLPSAEPSEPTAVLRAAEPTARLGSPSTPQLPGEVWGPPDSTTRVPDAQAPAQWAPTMATSGPPVGWNPPPLGGWAQPGAAQLTGYLGQQQPWAQQSAPTGQVPPADQPAGQPQPAAADSRQGAAPEGRQQVQGAPRFQGQYPAYAGQQYPPYAGSQYPGQQYPADAGPQYPGQQYLGQPSAGQQPGYPSGAQPPYNQPPYPYYGYQPQPERKPGKRVAGFVALALALLLGVTSLLWAVNRSGSELSSPLPTASQPVQTAPSGQEPTQQPAQQQEPTRQGSGSASGKVSAALSAGVVLIDAETTSGTAAGTGMVLSADGKVLTNYHVVAGSTAVQVTIADSGDTYTATVLGFDQAKDVALLQLQDASGLTTVTTDDDQVAAGDEVSAVGNAEGRSRLVKATGTVTGLDKSLTVNSDSPWGATEDLSGMIQTDAAAVPGDSGGPMFDDEGEVVGMTTAGSTKEGSSYAVPIETALAVVSTIEAGSDVGTTRVGPAGFLGIVVADTGTTARGKTVTQVVADSPADKAGIKAGSTLTEVDGTKITPDTNLATVIRTLEPGDRVSVGWIAPNGTSKSATVVLGSSTVN